MPPIPSPYFMVPFCWPALLAPTACPQAILLPARVVPQVVASVPTLLSNTVPVPGQPLNFQTVGLGEPRDINLIPFYQLQHQRYSVYWSLESETNWLQFADSNAVASARVIDAVNIGDSVSESAHDLVAVNSNSGNFD